MHPSMLGAARKIEAYSGRIALILHLARHANRESVILGDVIDGDVESAWAIASWFERHAAIARGLMTLSDEDRAVAKVISWIRKHDGSATLRDMMHGKALGRGQFSRAEYEAVMERALDAGRVTAYQGDPDRRVVMYALVA